MAKVSAKGSCFTDEEILEVAENTAKALLRTTGIYQLQLQLVKNCKQKKQRISVTPLIKLKLCHNDLIHKTYEKMVKSL
jgi:hypothetical protein